MIYQNIIIYLEKITNILLFILTKYDNYFIFFLKFDQLFNLIYKVKIYTFDLPKYHYFFNNRCKKYFIIYFIKRLQIFYVYFLYFDQLFNLIFRVTIYTYNLRQMTLILKKVINILLWFCQKPTKLFCNFQHDLQKNKFHGIVKNIFMI